MEWQFYLVWPFLIATWIKYFKAQGLAILLVGVCFLSFSSMMYWMTIDPTAAFYLSPFRIFEFVLGGLVYVAAISVHALASNIIGTLGLLMIGLSAVKFGHDVIYPGAWSLVPVFGTCLLVISRGSYVNLLLQNRILVFLGLISYSLYLVHWPLITFYKYFANKQLDHFDKFILGVVSLVLGYFLYVVIEKPFRVRGKTDQKMLGNIVSYRALVLGLLCAIPMVLSVFVIEGKGLPNRITNNYKNAFFGHLPCGEEGDKQSLDEIHCSFGNGSKGRILLVGDSHSRHFAYGFSQGQMGNLFQIDSIFSGSCLPYIPRQLYRKGVLDATCVDAKGLADKSLKLNDYDLVVYSVRWIGYEAIVEEEILELLNNLNGVPLLLVGPTPQPKNIQPCDRPTYIGSNFCHDFTIGTRDIRENSRVKEIANKLNITYIDLVKEGCNGRQCPFYRNNFNLYSDYNHLSTEGSAFYTELFKKVVVRSVLNVSDKEV